jgi:hypothetical protein
MQYCARVVGAETIRQQTQHSCALPNKWRWQAPKMAFGQSAVSADLTCLMGSAKLQVKCLVSPTADEGTVAYCTTAAMGRDQSQGPDAIDSAMVQW